jgi:preprotein translocase subunit YajC
MRGLADFGGSRRAEITETMDLSLLFPLLILLLFIPLFLQSRRAKRQAQEMQQLQASLEPGDVVMTTSGLRGTVIDASYEDTIDIEIADGVVTTWVRGAVREKINTAVAEDTTTSDEPAPADAEPEPEKAPSLEKGDSANGTPRS